MRPRSAALALLPILALYWLDVLAGSPRNTEPILRPALRWGEEPVMDPDAVESSHANSNNDYEMISSGWPENEDFSPTTKGHARRGNSAFGSGQVGGARGVGRVPKKGFARDADSFEDRRRRLTELRGQMDGLQRRPVLQGGAPRDAQGRRRGKWKRLQSRVDGVADGSQAEELDDWAAMENSNDQHHDGPSMLKPTEDEEDDDGTNPHADDALFEGMEKPVAAEDDDDGTDAHADDALFEGMEKPVDTKDDEDRTDAHADDELFEGTTKSAGGKGGKDGTGKSADDELFEGWPGKAVSQQGSKVQKAQGRIATKGGLQKKYGTNVGHVRRKGGSRAALPESCACALLPARNGLCWDYLPGRGKYCRERPCMRQYVCVDVKSSTLTCRRRVFATQTLPIGSGKCETRRVLGRYTYVPYSRME